MRLMIRYQDGRRDEAVLMAASQERMRIAAASQKDTVELTRGNEGWLTENGEPVDIEALIPMDGFQVEQFCAAIYPLTMTAGRGRASE